ncbi:MAG TPA: N-acetylglucosamine-6-phosphate deacetylase [Pyrinomonadaceae bacterium]|jgi:N-acetylglucosamine-6-phosphate deacetylase
MRPNNHGERPLLISNARVVLPNRLAEGLDVKLEDGRIVHIARSGSSEPDDPSAVIRLGDATLYPGFIDAHIHGAVGVDTNDTDINGLQAVGSYLARNGVTAWLPTLVPDSEDNYRKSIRTIDELMRQQSGDNGQNGRLLSRVLGVHYEGPFVSDKQCGALRSQFFKTFTAGDELESLPRLQDSSAVHLTTVAPEVEGGIDLVKELVRQGWIVSIGHTRASMDVLDQAFEAGARHLTHFMNAMAPLHHRAPGPVAWGLMRDDVTFDVIADGAHIDPFVLRLLLKLKDVNGVSLISDAIAAAGMGDGDYSIWGETITVKDGRTKNARGSIAGSVITMLDAARLMLSLGVSEVDMARMAATNPARLLGIDRECGSIAEGKRADLVALDKTGGVRLTIIGGEIGFTT